MTRVISLLTDFGLKDPYVGVLKGAILRHCNDVHIVDLNHNVPPQNIILAARTIAASYPFFPPATIHLVVVDPGVGTDRNIVVAEAADHFFIAPDNGVLSPILTSNHLQRCYFAINPDTSNLISNTFHGRDILAPLAARLACGMAAKEVGPPVAASDCLRIDLPQASITSEAVIGEVIGTDHFGNIMTSISADDIVDFTPDLTVSVNKVVINGLSKTYADVKEKELLALIDSSNYLEIGMNCGNAAEEIEMCIGQQVRAQRANP